MSESENTSPSVSTSESKTMGKDTKTNNPIPTRRYANTKKRKSPKKYGKTKTSAVGPKSDKAKNSGLKPQSDWRTRNFNRLRCPVNSASGDSNSKCFESCYSGELDMSHIREHLKNYHACDCDDQQTDPTMACSNPMHLSNEKLTEIKTLSKQHHESPGQAWRRMYQKLYPGRKIPVPYLVSFDQAEAVLLNPSEVTKAKLAHALEESDDETIKLFSAYFDTKECLSLAVKVLGVICETGASPELGSHEE